MISREMLTFRKGDILAAVLVLLLAAGVAFAYMPRGSVSGTQAEIRLNGEVVRTVSLTEDQIFTIEGKYANEIEVRDGKIAIVHSDCPGTDCVHTGFVGTPNRSIVCLPNALEIRILGGESEVDFVVG